MHSYRDESVRGPQASTGPADVLQYADDTLFEVESAKVQTTNISAGGHLAHHLDGEINSVVFDLLVVVLS